MKTNSIGIGGALALLAWTSPALAQDVEEFYCSLPELRIVISSSPGGGYDTWGRLVAQYMSRYIPCNPTFVVQNMPGGGGVRAGNYLYNSAPRDGSVISIIDRGILTAPLLYGESSETQFEGRDFRWLGSIVQELGVGIVRADSPFQSLEDTDVPVFFGASGLETDSAMYARLVNELLGTQIETITGYAGQTEYYLAMEQGETDGMFTSGWSSSGRLRYMRDRDAGMTNFFVQMSRERNEEIGLDVPTIYEYIEDPADRQVIDLLLSRLILGRPFITTPDVPEDRLEVLRDAFASAVSDPDLLAEIEQLNYRLSPILGEEAEEIMEAVYATPPEVIERVRAIIAVGE